MAIEIFKKKVEASEQGMRLDRWVMRYFPKLSFVKIQKLNRTGQLRVNGKRSQVNQILIVDQEIRMPIFEPTALVKTSSIVEISRQDIEQFYNSIIFEDDDYLAINKAQGIAVQGGTNTHYHLDLILSTIWTELATRPRIVHRLDRDTSGVIVFAKNHMAARFLAEAFRNRQVEKHYLAIVVGQIEPTEGLIDASIKKMMGVQKEKMAVVMGGDSAQTRYRVLKKSIRQNVSYVEFSPITGRTHQIRVHAAYLGYPILGDGKYGGKLAHALQKRTPICLHASKLSFNGATGKKYNLNAPLPDIYKNIYNECF